MIIDWGNHLSKKLETILYSLKEKDRGMFLRDIAFELGIKIENDSDKSKLRYRMNKAKKDNKDLEDIGYTASDGYILPVYAEDYYKLFIRAKMLGEGHTRRAQTLKAKGEKMPQKSLVIGQISWDLGM